MHTLTRAQSDQSSLKAVSEFLADLRQMFQTYELTKRFRLNAERSGTPFADYDQLLKRLNPKDVQSIKWCAPAAAPAPPTHAG